MNRILSKAYMGFLTFLFICTSTLAIESEFKNSLLKVDLVKVGENTYNINLYTQNKFQEPVKIIKKNDLNYYILLPETKNSATQTSAIGAEIRSISTNLYPYAGQDVNNGYTKININTSKPLYFNINVKNVASASKISKYEQKSTVALKPKATVSKENTIQKKNSNSIVPKTSETASSITKKDIEQKKVTQSKAPVEQKKPEVKKTETKPTSVQTTGKHQEILDIIEADRKELIRNQYGIEEDFYEDEEIQQTEDENANYDDLALPEEKNNQLENLDELKQIANDNKKFTDTIITILAKIKNSIVGKLTKYNISAMDLFVLAISAIATFIAVFILLSQKKLKSNRKNNSFFANKNETTKQPTQQNTPPKQNSGQYFVFDKNIKQTGLCTPASSSGKKNYELSSYEPELKNKYQRGFSQGKNNLRQKNSEYDIIQKILKEDSFIDLSADNYNEANKTLNEPPLVKTVKKVAPKPKTIQQNQAQQQKQAPKPTPTQEPVVQPNILSSVEIAPERGFMCVSYNNSINLMGYIFDDVFALYNFKIPKLENYDIKYRISERDDKGARFIVKVGGTKMLIKVDKSSMNLEVVL